MLTQRLPTAGTVVALYLGLAGFAGGQETRYIPATRDTPPYSSGSAAVVKPTANIPGVEPRAFVSVVKPVASAPDSETSNDSMKEMANEHNSYGEKEHAVEIDIEAEAGESHSGLFLDAQYMYLKPRRDAYDFGILVPAANLLVGSVATLDWDRRSGFRAGGGYGLGDGWEVAVYFTYLDTAGDHHLFKPTPNGAIFPTLTIPGRIEVVDEALATGSLRYHVIDAEFGRHFTPCEHFSMRLFGGGRFAWIDQAFDVYYNGGDASFASSSSPIEFDGAGFRVGGEGYWHLCGGLGVYAKASGALLIGNFHTSYTETNDNGLTLNANVSRDFEKIIPVADIGLGVSWKYRGLRISGGYEITNWFGLVDSPDFVDDVSVGKLSPRVGDLSLDGWLVRVEMSY